MSTYNTTPEATQKAVSKKIIKKGKKEIISKKSSSNRRKWNKPTFFDELKTKVNEKYFTRIKNLYNFFNDTDFIINWGTGNVNGSFSPIKEDISSKSLFTIYTTGKLQLNYAWFNESTEQLEFQKIYIMKFGDIFELNGDDIEKKYPNYPIEDWIDKINEIKDTIRDLINS